MPTRRLLLPCLVVPIVLACAACSKEAPPAPAATPPAAATAAAPATAPAPASTAAAAPAAAADRVFSHEELAQMVAPIALYPDPLLAQVLMAATYPGDVADAATWSKANPKATGDAAVKQVADQPWDPSVQALAAFPQVLATLGQDPGWVQRLGDAFLAQPDDVMDAVQVLRHKAQDAGNLANNDYQKISTQPAPARVAEAPAADAAQYDDSGAGAYSTPTQQAYTDTIVIESADPQVVYVPSYNPTTAYGAWSYPSYPPPYYPPPSAYYPVGTALARGLAWGTGVAIADSLWGDMDWNNNDVNINVSNYNSINTNRQISSNANRWEHNSLNRDGVPYRDQRSRDQYSNRLADSGSRDHLRGDDPARARQREQARQSMQGRGMDAPARTNREAQERANRARQDIARDGGRDAQRDRAQAAQRDRADAARAGGGRDAQRDRAQAASREHQRQASQQRDHQRAQQQQRDRANQQRSAQQRQQAAQHRQQGANNHASRDHARQQQQRQQRPHNDAFSGAQRPQQSRQHAQRGHASQGHARQQGGGRQQASHQVNRQPQRSGGGQQHARSGGAQRSGGGHRR